MLCLFCDVLSVRRCKDTNNYTKHKINLFSLTPDGRYLCCFGLRLFMKNFVARGSHNHAHDGADKVKETVG